MTIEEILAGESKNVEFKENLPEKSIKYMKSVVAFANGTGGKIIFGIADKTREVVGFSKEDVFKTMDAIANAVYRLEITSPGKLPMGQTLERMKEGYSQIRNEALAYAFSYMNLIEHWGSGIPRIIGKVKAAGLREPEFIGGEVDLRVNIYRGQINASGVKNGTNGVENGVELAVIDALDQSQKLLKIVAENPTATQAQYAEQLGVSKRTVSRIFADLQERGILEQQGSRRKAKWAIIEER